MLYLSLLILVPAAFLFFMQRSFIYHPRAYPAGYESALPAGAAELQYTTLAGQQVAFYLPPPSRAAVPERVWLTFSGNASVALDWLHFASRNPNQEDAFLLIDYPGYGKSEGSASVAGARASADKAVSSLAELLSLSERDLSPRLCVIGLSLGAAAALEFANGHPIQRAILIAPFTTLREVAATLFGRPASYLLLEHYDNRARLRELARRRPAPRVAIFHGTNDSIIPIRMGRELAQAESGMAQFFPVEGATHDTVVDEATGEIIRWMNQ